MNKKILFFATIALSSILGLGCCFPAMAAEMSDEADTEEQGDVEQEEQNGYITISVDAEDDNGDLMYAIDSDAPEAFGESNIFVVDPTIPHTIYVKDAAGNITSQSFQPIGVEYEGADTQPGDDAPSADTNESAEAAEDGGGTVYDKAVTDGTDDFSRVFYTLTTKEGEVFYLVIDQNRGQDNVYLLNMVTVDDLQALAAENGYILSDLSEKQSDSSMSGTDSKEETIEDITGDQQAKKKGSKTTNSTGTIAILILALVVGGVYYYLKVHKKKKNAAMDEIDQALDMDDFVSADREDEGDEIDMPVDKTMSDEEFYDGFHDEESYYDADPDDETIASVDHTSEDGEDGDI